LKFIVSALVFTFSMMAIAITQEPEKVDYRSLTLEDLLDVEVTTASKKKQAMSEAPAVISVLTRDQLQQLGVNKLADALSYLPGFSYVHTYWKPDIFVVRGARPTLYNDKLLMLINGIPEYDAASLEFFLDSVPMTAIERIEAIRGPGSTLYGTNAFAGVINIITRANPGDSASIELGSFGTREASAYFQERINGVNLVFAANVRDDDGYEKETLDETGTTGSISYERDIYSFFSQLTYKGWTFEAGHSIQHFGKFGALPVLEYGNALDLENGKATHKKTYANLVYSGMKGMWDYKITLHYDDTDKQSDVGNFCKVYVDLGVIDPDETPIQSYYRFGGEVLHAQIQFQRTWERFSLITGAHAEKRTVDYLASMADGLDGPILVHGSTTQLPFSTNDYGAFIQLDGSFTERLKYVAGIRLSHLGTNHKEYVTPRSGLVFNAERASFKLLYGQAFRSPGPQEQFYQVPALIYGPDFFGDALEPEQIETFELVMDAKLGPQMKLLASVFHTSLSDFIGRRDSTQEERQLLGNMGRVYDNLGEQTLHGLECEWKVFPKSSILDHFFANFSYKDGEEDDGSDIPFLAEFTGNMGAVLCPTRRLELGTYYQYIGSRDGTLTSGESVSVASYGVVNIHSTLELSEKLQLSLSIQNALDEDYSYPEFVRTHIATTPGGPGTGWFLNMSATF